MTTMNKNNLYGKFKELVAKEHVTGEFQVTSINDSHTHKIGCSVEGYPIFFISTSDDIKTSDIKLELFHVMFGRECSVFDVNLQTSSTYRYSIVQLNSHDTELQRYFIDVFGIVLDRLPSLPSTQQLKSEVVTIIQLFNESPELSLEAIRGLWAELFVINQSNNPDYLVRSWHVSPTDKYDFNDGQDKVEVKSTCKSERKHTFSLEQLNPNSGSQLLIASVFVIQTGIGKSVFDLSDSISMKLTDEQLQLKLREQVIKTIGPHFDEVSELQFDHVFACDTYKLFNYTDVPSIDKVNVPKEVTGVSFVSNLESIKEVEIHSFNTNSILLKSL